MTIPYIVVCCIFAFAVQNVDVALTSIRTNIIPAARGGSVKLVCDGWTNYHHSKLLFNDTKVTVKSGKFEKMSNGAYKIKNIQPSDTGIYKYKQSSEDFTYNNHCIINLQINEETMIVRPGSTATMKCKVPVPVETWDEVRWRKNPTPAPVTIANNGSVSDSAKDYFSGRISASWKTISISNAKEKDSGRYTCLVLLQDKMTRKTYYINLVISKRRSSTATPKTNEAVPSSTSTSSSSSSPTKGASSHKSCAARPASSFRLAVFVILQPLFCFFLLGIVI